MNAEKVRWEVFLAVVKGEETDDILVLPVLWKRRNVHHPGAYLPRRDLPLEIPLRGLRG
jgi:hypothetical protein